MAGSIPDFETLRRFTLGMLSEVEAHSLEEFLKANEGCVSWDGVDKDFDPLIATLRAGTTVEVNPEVEELLFHLHGIYQQPNVPAQSSMMDLLDPPISGLDGLGRVGPYIVEEEIGHGGSGVVYRAFDTTLNRSVALKFLLDVRNTNPTLCIRLEREALILANLKHPGIVSIYEVGKHRNRVYLSLEYLQGGTLAAHLKGNPQPIGKCAEIIMQLANAVEFAHQHGIIHRDLKPGNILLGSEDFRSAKIADFGLARRIDESGLTETGAILGTPGYMAPEQSRIRTDAVGPTVDVYSLGAILYELLTGRPPFRGETVLDTLEQARNSEPVSPRNLREKIPHDLETIVLKCLQRDPAVRYAKAGYLADDLKRFMSGKPIVAKKASVFQRLWKWGRRNPTAAALILVSLVSSVFLFAMQLRTQQALAIAKASTIKANTFSKRADENYRKARSTIQQILGRVKEPGTGNIPRVRDLKRQQQNDALSFYLEIAKQTDGSLEVRRDVALATYEVASIRAQFSQLDEALELFNKSLRLAEEVVSENPRDVEIRRLQIDSMTGKTYVSRENAEEILHEACKLSDELVKDFPDDASSYGVKATIWNNRGHYSFTEGDLDDAARCFRVSIETRERQLELDPMDHNARVSLASTCSNLQRILSTAGKPGTSQLAERAASLLEKLYREDPSDAFVICRLANQRVNYAYEQFGAGNSEKAINELTESIEVLERIYVSDPTDNDVSNALMSAHGARAELTEALEQFELAVPSWQRVVALVPQGELFWRKNCLLNVLVKAQRIDEAVVTLNELDELDNHKLTGQQYVDIARRAVICLKHDSALRWLKVAKDKASAEEWTRLKKLISEDAVFETLLVQHQSLWLKE